MKALKILGAVIVAIVALGLIVGNLAGPPAKQAEAREKPQDTSLRESDQPAAASSTGAIPSLNAADVYLGLKERGFTVEKDLANGASFVCSLVSPSLELKAEVSGSSGTEVTLVRAMVMADGATKKAIAGRDFLAFIASVPYANAQPQAAHDWVIQYYDVDGATTTIGGAAFTLKAPSEHYRMLLVEPAP